jgi:hypothetical protein
MYPLHVAAAKYIHLVCSSEQVSACALSLSASFSPCRIYIVVYIFVSGMKVCAVKSHCRQQLKANKKPSQRRGSATRRILSADKNANNLYTLGRFPLSMVVSLSLSLPLPLSDTRFGFNLYAARAQGVIEFRSLASETYINEKAINILRSICET